MKSIVTIKEYKTSTGWRFIVSDLGHVIEVVNDTGRVRCKRRAVEAAQEYRELVLDNHEDPDGESLVNCPNCGRTCSSLMEVSTIKHMVCEVCAKSKQSEVQSEDDEAHFDDLIKEIEDS